MSASSVSADGVWSWSARPVDDEDSRREAVGIGPFELLLKLVEPGEHIRDRILPGSPSVQAQEEQTTILALAQVSGVPESPEPVIRFRRLDR